MRAVLREVLFRGELPPTECPAAPLWGCALRVDETPGQPSRRGRYGLPHASTIVLGLLDRLVCVHLTVPNLPDAADTTSSMRFHLAVGVSVPLPESDNSLLSSNKPSGLSAVYVRGPRHSDAYDVTDAPSSSNGSQDGPLGLCLEAIVPLTDGAVLIVTLPASGGPSEIRRLLPPGSAQRCWHAAAPLGSLWTLSADTGLTQWRTGDRAAAADENGELTDGMLIGPQASKNELAEFRQRIKADPRNYMAQPLISLSTVPILGDRVVEPRHVDLRPFVLQGEKSYVTPGGLTRVAMAKGS